MTDDEIVTRTVADNRPDGRRPRVLGLVAVALIALSFALGGYGLRSASEDESDALGVARRVAGKAQALEQQVRSLGEKPVVDVPAPGQLPEQIAGPAGIPGVPGLTGERGRPGKSIRGPRGRRGRPGRPGSPGATGRPGADSTVPGPRGLPGADSTVPGPQGEVGPQGPGPACEPNCIGPAGPAGPQGQQGAAGVGIASIVCDTVGQQVTFTVTFTDGSQQTFSCGGAQ